MNIIGCISLPNHRHDLIVRILISISVILVALPCFALMVEQASPNSSSRIASVLRITESPQISLMPKGDIQKAKAGARYVILDLKLDSSIKEIETLFLVLTSPDGQIFPCEAVGGEDGKFRENSIAGAQNISAAFQVSESISLTDLEFSFGNPLGTVPFESSTPSVLSNKLSVQVKQVLELGTEEKKSPLSTFLLFIEITNSGQKPYRLHSGTVHLHFPFVLLNEKVTDWVWLPLGRDWLEIPEAFMKAMADPEKYQQLQKELKVEGKNAKPVFIVEPGKTCTLLKICKILKLSWATKYSELGFSEEHTYRLADIVQ